MSKYNILFVCIHNSARSQMAEAFLNKLAGETFHAESAGLEAGKLNPFVVEVMMEAGIDISNKGTQSVFNLFTKGAKYDAVITVCDAVNAQQCPIFPGKVKRISWSFPDPSSFQGTRTEILERTRQVRNEIKEKIEDFIEEANIVSYWI